MSAHHGAVRSGRRWSAVQIALAWISGPDMTWSSAAGVACTSCSAGAEAPTTTTRSRTSAGSTLPLTRLENETVSIVPGPPR